VVAPPFPPGLGEGSDSSGARRFLRGIGQSRSRTKPATVGASDAPT
jgi:hypothetical protein